MPSAIMILFSPTDANKFQKFYSEYPEYPF